ncbi:hypothetical protein MNAB215_4289 [Mycobacterium numidiamassiliense]|uniref:Uncharacterized protein n=1 Tax=Mycobacterium numidiamassiliense TaxID=1841861 RepID=A0A2U3PE92_9MYCO|nr:hypothetical protein [Mycobacterium numidiamassiliense]SPM42071.1 hypothetical protein MNAB215_4289 [Mycobacterium numidiamassiliense]
MDADEEPEEAEPVRDRINRLKTFASSLDDVEGESATEFVDKADDALRAIVNPTLASRARTPEVLLVLEALGAAARVTATIVNDWANTPDVRNRYTRESAQQLFKDALDGVLSNSERWLSEGLPSKEQIQQALQALAVGVQQDEETITKSITELDAQDAEAEADSYGSILIFDNPALDPSVIFEKVCSLTEDQDRRYRDAYERLRRMLDSELFRHISDESDRFLDQLIAVLTDIRDQRISLFDVDAWDEHRRKVRSALISFTAAFHSHREQTIRAVKKDFGRDSEQHLSVEKLFSDLRTESFDYGWLEELRGALQHGDINAFGWGFGASVEGPTANVYMKRQFMLDFTRQSSQKRWLKRRELQEMDSDPSVMDMIKAIQPVMGPLQDKLDKIMYPNVTQDVATVKELLARFNGRGGLHALQNGPGFTRRNQSPPISPLAPRVLQFVATYQDEAEPDS